MARAEAASRLGLIAFLVLVDLAVVQVALYLGYRFRVWLGDVFPIGVSGEHYTSIAVGVLAVPLANVVMQLYPGYGVNAVEHLRRRSAVTTVVFSSLIAWDYVVQDGSWSRGILIATWLIALVLGPVAASFARNVLVRLGMWGAPLVIIGAGAAGQELARSLRSQSSLGLNPVGFLDYDPAAAGKRFDGVPVLGGLELAGDLARRVPFAAVAVAEFSGTQIAELCARLPFPHVIVMPDLAGLQSNWVSPRDFGGILGLEVKKNLLLPSNRILKRIVDYAIAVPLFVLALPVLAAAVIAVMAVSPGNPFFRQERNGLDGRLFGMLKIRTMYPDAEARLGEHLAGSETARAEWLNRFKLADDPRILPLIGDFLRRSSLDELPQLINVLRGDMSLVGPRPFPAYHLDMFDDDFRTLRESVRPGLTGMWQVELRSDSDLSRQQFHDTYYIRNWSIWLDVYILCRTVTAVLSGKGAR